MLRIAALALPALSALALALLPAPAAAQRGAAADSARLLREVRAEQARFERVRRNHLPWAWGGGSGECDERIGRFCLSHTGEDEPEWEPPPEPEAVVRERDRLLGRLAAAARLLPGDAWVAGQRVRYLVEAKRAEEARAAAAECRAGAWWCEALAGFARHYAGDAAGADSAFSRALGTMPADERERWSDLSVLLDDRTAGVYRRLKGAERERFEERFWRLADPFYMAPGNDLRSEHLSRNVWDQLQDRARSAEGISWGSDLREILLRYGWPEGWERVRERPGSMEGPSILSHYPDTDLDLLPPASLFGPAAELTSGEWDREDPRPRTGYAVPTARFFKRVDHQIATFRRGDSVLVVAAYELPADSFPAGATLDAALVLTRGDSTAPAVRRDSTGSTAGALSALAAPAPTLLSLELRAPAEKRAARVRLGLALEPWEAGLPGVSDLLLLRAGDVATDSFPPVLARARGSVRVRPGERVGVYWEVYGLETQADTQRISLTLRLVDQRAGWLRRMAERAGLLGEGIPIRIGWQEPAAAGAAYLPRALELQIPETLRPGAYSLELTVKVAGEGGEVERKAVRPLEVTEAAG